MGAHLREVTAEARGPTTLRAGGSTAQALAAQDAIAALGVGAPCQVGAALHITSQEGLLVLWAEASCYEWWEIRKFQEAPHAPSIWRSACPLGPQAGRGTLEMTSGEETMSRMKAPVG